MTEVIQLSFYICILWLENLLSVINFVTELVIKMPYNFYSNVFSTCIARAKFSCNVLWFNNVNLLDVRNFIQMNYPFCSCNSPSTAELFFFGQNSAWILNNWDFLGILKTTFRNLYNRAFTLLLVSSCCKRAILISKGYICSPTLLTHLLTFWKLLQRPEDISNRRKITAT